MLNLKDAVWTEGHNSREQVGKILPCHTQVRDGEGHLRGCDEAVEGTKQAGRLGRRWTRWRDAVEPTWGTGTASQTEDVPGVRTQRRDGRWPLKGPARVPGGGHPGRAAAGRAWTR